jgi:HK97 family phage prohead protease
MGEKFNPDVGGITFGGSLMHADESKKADFSGYVTKVGVRCSDGRTITAQAFKHQDKATVPMVWQHTHDDPQNVLGHFELEHREDGVYGYGFFNDTEKAQNAKALVEHGDIKSLSIYANQLLEKAQNVMHGVIREVSLVLAGANPGAFIDNISLQHEDEVVTLDDEAIIYTGLNLEHEDKSTTTSTDDNKPDDPTVQEVYDSMSPEQKEVVHYMVGAALEGASTESKSGDAAHTDKTGTLPTTDKKEGRHMSRNVFEAEREKNKPAERHVLSHDAIKGIVEDANRTGSLKEAVEKYALAHGIENIDTLFPDAKAVSATPEFDSRRMEWVKSVINGTRHSPFSRIKSLVADITHEEARAKGYIKGTLKKEEFFSVSKRVTTPSTIYKKQKLDRDDILDITDFDVVAWLKAEMRLMLEEELARAILIGDGRDVADEDKIKDPIGATEGAGIRSIVNDHELYVATVNVNVADANSSPVEIVEAVMRAMRFYKGSGSPTFYTTLPTLTTMLLAKDGMNRRLWRTASELASEMGVANIVTVEVMEDETDLVGIIVNLTDYTVGADKGGDISMFDDFDIDYNQYKYLLETRLSGALTKIRSALVVRSQPGASTLVTPAAPTFDEGTGAVTIHDTANVVYTRTDTGATVTSASSITVAPGTDLTIHAAPTSGHYFESNQDDDWTFERPAA